MSKLTKYNQKLLAVLGTLAIIGILLLIGTGLFSLLQDVFRSPTKQDGVVVNPNKIVNTNKIEFKQKINVLKPLQLDSTKALFLIPIGQKNQTRNVQSVPANGEILNSFSSGYSYSSFSGVFNNFVLINYDSGLKEPIFKKKVAISEYSFLKIDSTQVIVFSGTDADQNLDGQLDEEDFQKLFVYRLGERRLEEFSFPQETVISFKPLLKTTKIYVRTGKDVDKDGTFDTRKEPMDLYFYDVRTGQSETLVPDSIKLKIQRILDGNSEKGEKN